ncbi:MAG: hypothetical protein KGQ70_05670 [Alphaproteobacteria bacterium]|nr:hypothetical protein [Alphaproteobacteria bacterium]
MKKAFAPFFAPRGGVLSQRPADVRNYSRDEDESLYPSPAGTPLTAGEAALVKSIFGDAIKTEDVRKHFSAREKPGSAAGYVIPAQTFGTDCIKFYGPRYACDDYSRTDDIFNYGTFIHEMTHIWQNRQNYLSQPPHNTPENGNNTYEYALTPQTRFKKLGEEQQAKIIEDYARQFLFLKRLPAGETDKYLPSHAKAGDHADLYDLRLLQKTVEDAFPQARKTRMALEAQLEQKPPQSPKPGF